MRFEATNIEGVWLITPDRFDDERGFFARTWGLDEFEAHGIDVHVVQRNAAYNRSAGTLRGMHFQRAPYSEDKIVSCPVGAVYDVAIDIRPESPTFGQWYGAELRGDAGAILYVPKGCAHGYVTLEPDTKVEYLISEYYHPEAADGVRWDDPFFNVAWPIQPTSMNARDRTWPDFLVSPEQGMPIRAASAED
jgi:dTDP-4-dehydrorhamnose 3,5-epimerase